MRNITLKDSIKLLILLAMFIAVSRYLEHVKDTPLLYIAPVHGQVEPETKPVIETIEVITQDISTSPLNDDCSKPSFISNNDGYVEINRTTYESIMDHRDCTEREILLRLAHYETTQGKSTLMDENGCNIYGYCGLFQIGDAAWFDCHKVGITDDSKCAMYHFEINPNRFEAYSRNTNSFNL